MDQGEYPDLPLAQLMDKAIDIGGKELTCVSNETWPPAFGNSGKAVRRIAEDLIKAGCGYRIV